MMVLAMTNELGYVALHLLAADSAVLHWPSAGLGLASIVAIQFVYSPFLLM